ncbi:kinase-like domain-containing protein [Rhizophagus irregularis DAOM 181602=DAOM 197198]|nr:kinase-like domain-containing protein [Rhizophagus irregularis DAOM 181602=DAOM 197198]
MLITESSYINEICEECDYTCNTIHFKRNFKNWTSGNDNIDKLIQDTQLSAHDNYDLLNVLEWIPSDRLYNIKYVAGKKMYRANWVDGCMDKWDNENENWKRVNQHMTVDLKSLNNSNNISLEFMNEIRIDYEFYGITQDSKTKAFMMVLNTKCRKCECICNIIHLQRNFVNWTSGNDDIDKFIQFTQLSAHKNTHNVLEWIPFDKFYGIKYIKKMEVYRANWINGYIDEWNNINQNWRRVNQNMIVILKNFNNLENITLEFMNKVKMNYKFYGITQNPETKNYKIVYNCKKCKHVCNAVYFQQNFINWTSGNDVIDKFIQYTQLLTHNDIKEALEWIPYDKFYDIKYIEEMEVYRANWINGCIDKWSDKSQSWNRLNQNMTVILKNLNNPENTTLEFMNEVKINYKFYGITQNPETKNYKIVYNCKKCKHVCNAVYFQQNFINWTSGNDVIDKFIQYTQLLTHNDIREALEWIPYDKFYDIKYIEEIEVYKANWINGCIDKWSDKSQSWNRLNQNMTVILKNLNNPENTTLEFMNEVKINYKFYGITQNPETKNYKIVYNCKKCKHVCNAVYFQQNFVNWTSGSNIIDGFIQKTQLSACTHYDLIYALEWIPFDRFYNVKYIAKGGFGKVYRANWIDGYINEWNNETQNWKRNNKNMCVALKSLNNSKNITFEFINEITLHKKGKQHNAFIIGFYGITQDPETKNYVMVLEYAKDGSLRNYLDKRYHELNWENKISYLQDIILGLKGIHEKELIHRDLHIGNVLKLKYNTAIADMGLCKPADYKASENAKNNIYGILSYIAPEILRGQNYTQAADIYSFGIIMYEVIAGLPPYYDLSHDKNLAIKICMGLRPRFNIKVPQLIVSLIKSCLDANPSNRPEVDDIYEMLKYGQYGRTELQEQIKEIEETNKILPTSCISLNLGLSYKTHSEAIYTSRLLNFSDLPKPKNSDDYYEQNDNIISKEFSESLQIDIS